MIAEPMDRRDFLWRLWIGAAFALAGIPLLGDVLREWARTKQREREFKIPLDVHREYGVVTEEWDGAWRHVYGDQHGRVWAARIGPRLHVVDNNYLRAKGEIVLFGGRDP